MNPVIYERIMSLIGLIVLWAFWYYLWRPQRIDVLRQKLFALRTDLFELAASGVVPFDHPAYEQLRLLVNGMIRFAHRATFPTFLMAALATSDAPSDSLAQWRESVQTLPEDAQKQLLAVHASVSKAFVRHLTGGSVFLTTYLTLRVIYAVTKASLLLVTGKRDFSSFTVAHARVKVDRESTGVARTASAIEARVLHDEQQRMQREAKRKSGVDRDHAYAH